MLASDWGKKMSFINSAITAANKTKTKQQKNKYI